MKKRDFILLCVLGFSLAMLIASCSVKPDNLIAIGSKNSTEQLILGELLAQNIEANTDLKVERKLNLGDTFVCHDALTNGEIDAYVEYTATAFSAILKNEPISNPEEVYQLVKQKYQQNFLVAGNSTDGKIGRSDLAVLKDDRLFFPPYQVVPIVRQQTLQKHPELREVFQQLSGKISEPEMQRLNFQVEGESRDVKQVVQQFLQTKGLKKN
ncbi:MAG: glycine betaine ABC transporter substrate-binding protein [Phormidium sp.]